MYTKVVANFNGLCDQSHLQTFLCDVFSIGWILVLLQTSNGTN